MAIFYTDIALNQQLGLNFPGAPGAQELTNQPGTQNDPITEGPPEITATYTWLGTEAAGDKIRIGVAPAQSLVSPKVTVASGTTAPATTLTVAIGDNDLDLPTNLPLPNPQTPNPSAGTPTVAPTWLTGTAYVAGNVTADPGSTPANQLFTCIVALTSSTQPHSDSTHWIANQVRYSASIDIHAANGNVAGVTGTQLYGGVASMLPSSVQPGVLPTGLTTNQLANMQYKIQQDCWIEAVILTANTIVAGTVSIFRIPLQMAN
jgi:hypothetical protein